jgi:uncharacterized repeat protein (TIGR03803 family)
VALLWRRESATAIILHGPQSLEAKPVRKLQIPACTILALALLASAPLPANAQFTLDVLHGFAGGTDGNYPQGGVIHDAEGNLYGTTAFGGVNCIAFGQATGCGTVYKIDKNGEYTVLYRFLGGNDGAAPRAGLAIDPAGNLYGTTQGQGVVGAVSTLFRVDASGHETVLQNLSNDGSGGSADSAPAVNATGVYGTTPFGGPDGNGVIYKVDVHGKFSIVHTFTDIADGALPHGGLVFDAKGNLYGATANGGDGLQERSCYSHFYNVFENGCGTIFRITPNGEFNVLYRFQGGADGGTPVSVVLDPAGNLYGVTDSGGALPCDGQPFGCGTIFKIDTTGKFSVLHTFEPNPYVNPNYNNLFLDSKGNIYGSNQDLPWAEDGFLFELDTTGNYSVLYTFSDRPDGWGINGAMIAPNGDFYGTLGTGGGYNCGGEGGACGTVFKLTP